MENRISMHVTIELVLLILFIIRWHKAEYKVGQQPFVRTSLRYKHGFYPQPFCPVKSR